VTLRAVALGETGLQPTVLGFGCADLFREPSRAGRRALLETAHDAGIRYFDVAPMYGLGLVEGEVGAFVRGRRDDLVLATKFGIAPTPLGRGLAHVQGQLQRARGARGADGDPRSGTVGTLLYRTGAYSAEAARQSLNRSLRELGTDHVDLFLVHDPPESTIVSDALRGYLETARANGLIRAWGVAGDRVAAQREAPVLQQRWHPFSPVSTGPQPTVYFGVIGRPLRRVLDYLRSEPDVADRWSEAVGADCSRPDTIAALLLRAALEAAPGCPLLFSSSRAAHITAAVEAASEDAGTQAVAAFRRLLADELRATEPTR
jgi:D-threo-aldose 1-dehydrogenase